MHTAKPRTAMDARDYSGTTIKTPFEKMRANAIINAKNDTAGLSLINFNITAFLPKSKREDAYYLLSQWAIEPINLQKQKFLQYPQQGTQALIKRADLLIENLSKRNDLPDGFLEISGERMKEEINKTMHSLSHANTGHEENTAIHA